MKYQTTDFTDSSAAAVQDPESQQIRKRSVLYLTLLICLINLAFFHSFKYYKTYLSGGDSWGYYTYLTGTFIYNDLGDYHKTLDGTRQVFPDFADPYVDKYGIRQSPTGHYIIKYTSGVGVMLSPFFLAAHAYCKVTGYYKANGYTLPYQIAIGWGIIFWVGFAYYFLIKLLLRYFSKWVVIHTVLAISFATNLFYNTTYNSIMSHALLFSLYSFLLYFTDLYYRNFKLSNLIKVSISAAFIILVRPNELYCLFIPLLYNITTVAALKERFIHFKNKITHYLIAAFCALLIFVPQLIYWKTFTGSWIYNAYVGEHFDFANPHIYEGFFSYSNGWLVWSPFMIFSLVGMFFLFRKAPHIALPLLLIFVLHIYVIYSWWCYNYINGFGSRPMEHLYPILSFSLASFFVVISKARLTKVIGTLLLCIGVSLNIFQTWQVSKGYIFTESMNEGFYWGMFAQTGFNKKAILGFASEEIQRSDLKKLKTIYSANFNDTADVTNVSLPQFNRTMRCLQNQVDSITTFSTNQIEDSKYLIVQLTNMYPSSNTYLHQWDCPIIIFRHLDKDGKTLHDSNMRPHIVTGNKTFTFWTNGVPDYCEDIEYNIRIAKIGKTKSIVVCTWNPTEQPFYIDDFKISIAE